jgi:hypothetical protein
MIIVARAPASSSASGSSSFYFVAIISHWAVHVPFHERAIVHRTVAVSFAQTVHYEILNLQRNAWPQCVEPLETSEPRAQHLSDEHRLSAARLHVDLLLVVEILGVPLPQIARLLCVPNVHETECSNVCRVGVI